MRSATCSPHTVISCAAAMSPPIGSDRYSSPCYVAGASRTTSTGGWPMRAVVYSEPERLTVADAPDPSPGPGQVVVRPTLTGVCGTDLHLHRGEFFAAFPLTPGHEITGVVTALGD